jgi:hypothetical protein
MNKAIQLHQEYIHYKNKLSYIPIEYCKIQENDVWVDAVIYKTQTQELFVRSVKEFKSKFAKK